MSPARSRARFELLHFAAVATGVDVAVVELEGRFGQEGRFVRAPRLVVERDGEEPVRVPAVRVVQRDDGVWRAGFALPLEALDGGRFALGLRSTLLELPSPDVDDGDRLTAVAREANRLRRRLEAVEANAEAARADRDAAVAAARDEAERALRELREEHDAALRAVREEADDALRALRADRDAAVLAAEEERDVAVAATEARAASVEQQLAVLQQNADEAHDALDVERRRATGAAAELQTALDAARVEAQRLRAELDARRAEDAARPDDDPTRTLRTTADATLALPPDDGSRPLARPVPRREAPTAMPRDVRSRRIAPAWARWVAVAALLLFVVVLALLVF